MDAVDYLWEIVKDLVRTLPSAAEEEISFMIYGHPLGLTARVFYPPVKTCINSECTAWQL